MWAVPATGDQRKGLGRLETFGFLLACPHLKSFHLICFFVLLCESEFNYVKYMDLCLSETELPMTCKCLS